MKLPTLKSTVTGLENAVITLSGPAIAISGIIAGIDLLTGGSMFKNVSWLSLTWAICLLLTLDFQVLMLGARAKQIYNGNKGGWKKVFEIVAIMAIAVSISYVSVQMQSIIARSQTPDAGGHTITIDQATREMGINPIALIWERSSLVLILIFMSGWLRDEKPEPEDQSQSQPVALNYEELATQVAPLLAPTLDTFKATLLEELQKLEPQSAPAPAIDYESVAQIVAPLMAPEPLPQINYQEVARNIAPLLRPTFTEVHRTIIEEVRAIIPQLAPAPLAPAPQIGAASQQHRATFPVEPEPGEETDAQRAARLEAAYQELHQEGKRISGRALADRARANRKAATEWLREKYPDPTGTEATPRSQNLEPVYQTRGATEPVLEAIQRQEVLAPDLQPTGTGASFQRHLEPFTSGAESTDASDLEPVSTGITEALPAMELAPAPALVSASP
jgi:hypothetical protein